MCLVCVINAEESRARKPPKGSESNVQAQSTAKDFSPSVSDLDTDVSSEVEEDEMNANMHAIHYFAIGSMTNMTALALRGLTPISSQPAILTGFRMLFRGSGGMASAERDGQYDLISELDVEKYPFPGIHGVLHLLSAQQMKILDDFEGGYNRKACKVILYDGRTEVNAYVYQMDRKLWEETSKEDSSDKDSKDLNASRRKWKHELPTERYLDIIAQGCESHGVDSKWIEFIRSHPCIPRKRALEFSSFSASMTSATVPIISWEQVRVNNGLDGKPLWIVINNKVLEFKGDRSSFFPFGYFIRHKIGGTDFTVKFAKGFFEPKYINGSSFDAGRRASISIPLSSGSYFSSVSCSAELGNEHRAWIEDQFANPPPVLASSKWTLVGVVEVVTTSTDAVALARNSTFGIRKAKRVSSSSTVAIENRLNICTLTRDQSDRPPRHIAVDDSADADTAESSESGVNRNSNENATLASSTDIHSTFSIDDSRKVLNLSKDIYAGCNQLFISGTSSSDWIIPNGVHPGQTLYLRKTATENYPQSVMIHIRNQTLSSPNIRSDCFEMAPSVYFLAWCWDGDCWFLEQVGEAR